LCSGLREDLSWYSGSRRAVRLRLSGRARGSSDPEGRSRAPATNNSNRRAGRARRPRRGRRRRSRADEKQETGARGPPRVVSALRRAARRGPARGRRRRGAGASKRYPDASARGTSIPTARATRRRGCEAADRSRTLSSCGRRLAGLTRIDPPQPKHEQSADGRPEAQRCQPQFPLFPEAPPHVKTG